MVLTVGVRKRYLSFVLQLPFEGDVEVGGISLQNIRHGVRLRYYTFDDLEVILQLNLCDNRREGVCEELYNFVGWCL